MSDAKGPPFGGPFFFLKKIFQNIFIPAYIARLRVDMMEGFVKIDMADYIGKNRSFVSAPEYENGIDVQYLLSEENDLAAEIHFSERAMGPPDHVHGGAMAAVMDEAMGVACWFKKLPVVTRTMTANYIRMLPIGTTVILRTSVNSNEEGDVTTKARLMDPGNNKVYATAEGKFAILDPQRMERLGMVHVRDQVDQD